VTEALLEVNGLRTWFGRGEQIVKAIDGISFAIKPGETFALLGESGCGKSMTALSIMRLLPPAARIEEGNIALKGRDLLGLPEYVMRDIRGGQISMIFQEPQSSLNPVLTCGQQIGEALQRHKGLGGRKTRQRTVELLDAVGIPDPDRRADEYPHQFSGGMKQRIMIAMALAGEPALLIADEPTTALDVTIQAQILALMKSLQDETGMAILFITHDLAVASEIADTVAVMYDGKIVEMNQSRRFFSDPQHEYSLHLFNSIPAKLDPVAGKNHINTPAGDSQAILSVKDLKVYYPIRKGLFKRIIGYVEAVDGVSLELYKGRTLALVGESGSGKTTMGKGILQLTPVTAGNIIFDGAELTQLGPRQMRHQRSELQVIFQDPYASMNPRMMVADIIAEGMIAQDLYNDKSVMMNRIDELLRHVGLLPEHKSRYPHEFSGGQRQRICIARALAVDPKLIICDEPTSALDVSVQAQILELLKRLQDELGLSYIFITHDLSVVEFIAHDVAVMYQGRLVEQGNVTDVLYSPQHPYTRRLLSAVPRIRTGTD